MPKDKTSEMFEFQLKGIEILDICLISSNFKHKAVQVFNFNITLDLKVNDATNYIFIIVTVDILDDDKETKLGSLKTSCIFSFNNLDNYIDKTNKSLNLPDLLLQTLNSISISTTRGVMFSEFKGTFLHTAVLPIIDPKTFQKDIK